MIKNFKIFLKNSNFLCQIFEKVIWKTDNFSGYLWKNRSFFDIRIRTLLSADADVRFWCGYPRMRISADADVRYITAHYIFPSTLEIHTQSTMTHRDWIKGERCMGPLKTDHSNLDASRFDAKLMNLCPTISWGRYVCQSMRMNITSKLVMGRIWLLRIRGFRFYARMHSKRSNWREAKIIVIRSKI